MSATGLLVWTSVFPSVQGLFAPDSDAARLRGERGLLCQNQFRDGRMHPLSFEELPDLETVIQMLHGG